MSKEKKNIELKDEELEKVNGGNDKSDNPKGLKPGDQVYFYKNDWGVHMWGQFESYNSGYYKISWSDTTIFINDQTINIPANYHGSVREEEIK